MAQYAPLRHATPGNSEANATAAAPPARQNNNRHRRPKGSWLPLQRNLELSEPGDAIEHAARSVARNAVLRSPETDSLPAGTSADFRQARSVSQEQLFARKPTLPSPSSAEGVLSTSFHASLATAQTAGGEALPASVRSFMKAHFEDDFSSVRVHRDPRASAMAGHVRAKAFTIGADIFFGAGEFEPTSTKGRGLIAHELAHVVQQRGVSQYTRLQRVPTASGVRENEPRYSFSTHCGWIDWSHAEPGFAQTIVDAVTDASNRIRAQLGPTPTPEVATPAAAMRSSVRVLGTLSAVTPSVEIKRALTPSEVNSVALTLFQFTSLGFEMQQQVTEWLGHSSYSQEDQPSNMLAFYRAVLGLDRAGVERECDVWSKERSAQQIEGETFTQNRTFAPTSLPAGGAWPARFASISPAEVDGPLMGVPTAEFESISSRGRRGLGFFDQRLQIRPVAGLAPFDISDTQLGPEHGPQFEVGPAGLTQDVEYRWSLRDNADNAFSMWGADGHQVHQFSSQRIAYIPSQTRALLRERNIRSGVVLCRIRLSALNGANETRRLGLPVTFRF